MSSKVRLVYSERQQCFHNDDVNEPYVVGGGYAIIKKEIDREAAYKFTEIIYKKYPYPSLHQVRMEMKDFDKLNSQK